MNQRPTCPHALRASSCTVLQRRSVSRELSRHVCDATPHFLGCDYLYTQLLGVRQHLGHVVDDPHQWTRLRHGSALPGTNDSIVHVGAKERCDQHEVELVLQLKHIRQVSQECNRIADLSEVLEHLRL